MEYANEYIEKLLENILFEIDSEGIAFNALDEIKRLQKLLEERGINHTQKTCEWKIYWHEDKDWYGEVDAELYCDTECEYQFPNYLEECLTNAGDYDEFKINNGLRFCPNCGGIIEYKEL